MEIKLKNNYGITKLYDDIESPTRDKQSSEARKEAFETPEIYKKIIADCNSIKPENSILINILKRDYGFNSKTAPKAARIFFRNIEDLKQKGIRIFTDDNPIIAKSAATGLKSSEMNSMIIQSAKYVMFLPDNYTEKDLRLIEDQIQVFREHLQN
ncbi:MAG: hypothetical protein QM710_00850 [Flavobacterium sp.]